MALSSMDMTSSELFMEARDIDFAWGSKKVLDGFSLNVKRGSVMCLMGMNGCGKSTFLDCILGSNGYEKGIISIDGKDLETLKAHERAKLVSYVPQSHERTFPFTVLHVVMMGRTAHLKGLSTPDDEDEALAWLALERCGIGHLAERPCTELSGGEMQMVLLARALVQEAPMIVLDEPTAHLDIRNELLFLETMAELISQEGTTVLMATHSPDQALLLESAGVEVDVALMKDGHVAYTGNPKDTLRPEAFWDCFGVKAEVATVMVDGNEHARMIPLGTSLKEKENQRG